MTMSANLTKLVAALAGDLESPAVVADIDRVLVHILGLRKIAADLHGVAAPAPVILTVEASAEPLRPAAGRPSSAENQQGLILSTLAQRYRTNPRSPYQFLRSK